MGLIAKHIVAVHIDGKRAEFAPGTQLPDLDPETVAELLALGAAEEEVLDVDSDLSDSAGLGSPNGSLDVGDGGMHIRDGEPLGGVAALTEVPPSSYPAGAQALEVVPAPASDNPVPPDAPEDKAAEKPAKPARSKTKS
ncbi:MAG: hypothetical protein RBS05_05760 [Zoogloea oleivorans]|jgi:hypothetical protein|uniref:hypothetical protein n=1 Tax=Zoogloea oleivorans TaxID=1552750 RepID=UPI002A37117D|nr:hypothetical protein [Zoogloea oleivorans]MDY0035402.1 hypothetical protein [Zoogloea oleivorans]